MTKKIVLIIKSTSCNCHLILPEKNALRLVKKIIKEHKRKSTTYNWSGWNGTCIVRRRKPTPKESIEVTFKHI